MFFEFHPSYCLVCDVVTNEVLLSGSESGGLYKLDFSQMCSQTRCSNVQFNDSDGRHMSSNDSSKDMLCFSGQMKISSFVLHKRLGHPSSHILSLIVKTNHMNVSPDLQHCGACAIGKS